MIRHILKRFPMRLFKIYQLGLVNVFIIKLIIMCYIITQELTKTMSIDPIIPNRPVSTVSTSESESDCVCVCVYYNIKRSVFGGVMLLSASVIIICISNSTIFQFYCGHFGWDQQRSRLYMCLCLCNLDLYWPHSSTHNKTCLHSKRYYR